MEIKPGEKLGPYEILSSIGEGGMGEVWKARDTRLDRIVAIKRLKQEYSGRFERESRAIAALNHPHICQIHDVGPDYLVLEYVEGKPLHGPMPVADAVAAALQIAGALEAAHARGILHRDIKPGNILMSATGPKLLDFGLAKVASEIDATTFALAGTPLYMSPEQAEGKPLDVRSDIFSLGVVLYEILAGRRAFDTLAAVLRDEPAALESPVAGIVKRCMSKDPGARFQSMPELRAALGKIAIESVNPQPSIAVLPFANMSADKENEYFSDGLAEEILNALAQIQGLKVIARTSSFAFRGKEQDITKIAETLRVKTILEGSVRRAGSRIRVTAQLIDATDGSHIWSERYDRELTDVFAVQDEIAAAIAGMLRDKLGSEQPRARLYKPGLPAYEAYLKGQYKFSKYTADGISTSRQFFEEAVRLDPKYVEPRLALVSADLHLVAYGLRPAREVVPRSRAAVHEILALDNVNANAHRILGAIAAFFDYDWDEADRLFRRAAAQAPADFGVRWSYAIYCQGPILGRLRDALDASAKLVEQDPLSVFARGLLTYCLNVHGLYDEAAREARAALDIENYWLVHYVMAEAWSVRGMFSEAAMEAEQAYLLAPWHARAVGILAGALTRLGRREEGSELLNKLENASPFGMVLYHVLVDDMDAAADWFAKSVEQREPFAVMYSAWPILRPLRESHRWPALAKMMNLPENV
jgi:eukaryotic-like serine/threonine-protein kinase